MDMDHGNLALATQAETLMLQALTLLDEARMSLPAAHLQSALDMIRWENANWTASRLERELFSAP